MPLSDVTGPVTGLRWYLPLARTPQDKNVENQADAGVINANGALIRDTALQVDKVPRRFLVDGGDQADPEAAPDQSFGARGFELDGHGRGSFPLGNGRALEFDANTATVTFADGGLRTGVWGGDAAREPGTDTVDLDEDTRVTVETAVSAGNANAVTPASITIDAAGTTTTLRAAE